MEAERGLFRERNGDSVNWEEGRGILQGKYELGTMIQIYENIT